METVTLCSATRSDQGRAEPPLGPLYIAAALEKEGVAVDFRDYQVCPEADAYNPVPLVRFLEGHEEMLLISCFVDMLPVVLAAMQQIVQHRPDTSVILGGPGPSALSKELLEAYPWVTGIARGEGEETIRAWFTGRMKSLQEPIAGMVYRSAGTILEGPLRRRIEDVDALPMPAYHLLDWEQYPRARVITTRGCAYRCTFCDVAALWQHRSVFRDLCHVLEEMEYLRLQQSKSSIAVVDDTFVLNPERVRQFCKLLVESGNHYEWGCFGRINLMTHDLIELMAEAGCRAIFYGIDSGSVDILRRINKSFCVDSVLPVLELSAKYFEKIEASFIWGYPFESLDDFRETLNLAGKASFLAPKVNIQLHLLSPLPNSPLYKSFQGKLVTPEPEDAQYLLLPNIQWDRRGDAVREIVATAPHLFPGFYLFPTIDRHSKRHLLDKAMKALDRIIGMTYLDENIGSLLERDNNQLENVLLNNADDVSTRIGVGLALGMFRRVRRRNAFANVKGPEIDS